MNLQPLSTSSTPGLNVPFGKTNHKSALLYRYQRNAPILKLSDVTIRAVALSENSETRLLEDSELEWPTKQIRDWERKSGERKKNGTSLFQASSDIRRARAQNRPMRVVRSGTHATSKKTIPAQDSRIWHCHLGRGREIADVEL
jgi:hypothetical protein